MEMASRGWRQTLDVAATQLDQMGMRTWLVGGCLRDALVGRPVHDVDLAVLGDPLTAAQQLMPLMGRAVVPLKRQTVRLVLGEPAGAYLDLSAVHGGSLEDDLRARDFTLNALALPLSARRVFLGLLDATPVLSAAHDALPAPVDLVDPLSGYADLRGRRLVPASEHALLDDPLRLLRAARLAADLDLTAPAATLRLMREAAPALARVAPERVGSELALFFRLVAAARGWRLLREADALLPLFPQLAGMSGRSPVAAITHLVETQATLAPLHPAASVHLPDPARLREIAGLRAWYAASATVAERIVQLRWGALAHALTPHPPPLLVEELASDQRYFARTKVLLPPALVAGAHAVATLVGQCWPWVRHLLLAEALDLPAWRRFFAYVASRRDVSAEEVSIHVIVTELACQAALVEEGDSATAEADLYRMVSRVQEVLPGFLVERDRWLLSPLLTGAEILRATGVPPGPWIGDLLAQIRAAQLDERITTREEALRLARLSANHGFEATSQPGEHEGC